MRISKQVIRITLLLGTIIICVACTDLDSESNGDLNSTTSELPDTESWDAVLHFTKEGKPVAVLTAGYIATYRQYKLLSDSVRVDFYDEAGKHKSVLTSQRARVINDTQDMYAMGNVIVISDEGAELYTEELMWMNDEQKVVSKVPVTLKTETETVHGNYFKSDPDLKEYDLHNTRASSQQTISLDD
jgi:LPS export ABC transporter protein LptC